MSAPHDPTELAASVSDTASVYAWGLAEDYEEPPVRFTAGRITTAAVVASLMAVAAAGVLGWHHLRPVDELVPTAETMVQATIAPTTTVTAVAKPLPPPPLPPPPPVTITTVVVQAPPKPPQAAPDYDRQFLTHMANNGWLISDPNLMIRRAGEVCGMLQSGYTVDAIHQRLLSSAGGTAAEAESFTTGVILMYPGCR